MLLTITPTQKLKTTETTMIPAFKGWVWFMNDEYFKEHAKSLADPFTKQRLLALAERYDAAKPSPRQTPPPAAAAPEPKKRKPA